jgi:hypothetical protein
VGNQPNDELNQTQINPELKNALKRIIPNNYLDTIGFTQWLIGFTQRLEELLRLAEYSGEDEIFTPAGAQTLADKIDILKRLNVTEDTLKYFVNCNILKEEFIRSIIRWIPTSLAGLALSVSLNVNPVISAPILYTLGTMMQAVKSNNIRKGLEVVMRDLKR